MVKKTALFYFFIFKKSLLNIFQGDQMLDIYYFERLGGARLTPLGTDSPPVKTAVQTGF